MSALIAPQALADLLNTLFAWAAGRASDADLRAAVITWKESQR